MVLKFKTFPTLRWWLICIIAFLITYALINQLSKASLYGLLNVFTVDLNENLPENINDERHDINQSDENHLLLETFSARESDFLSSQLKIYFVQTSENDDLLSRHACSIESAVRLHPNALIFLLMRSKYINLKKGAYRRVRSYTNLRLIHFDEQDVYSGTTLAQLDQIKRTQYIRYFAISHMSDFIRTALLFKYGGVYFDLDVIPLRSFSSFHNVVALETNDAVNVAAMKFDKQHLVLDIQMDIQLASVKNHFNAFCWNCVGPLALTDALKRVCDREQLTIHSKDKCQQIDIQPSFVFYPIAYQNIPQFFRQTTTSNSIDFLIRNSSIYSLHYFHHMTMNLPIESMSPFERLAQIYCPMVYEQLINQTETKQNGEKLKTSFAKHVYIIPLCLLVLFIGTYIYTWTCTSIVSIRLIFVALQKIFLILL